MWPALLLILHGAVTTCDDHTSSSLCGIVQIMLVTQHALPGHTDLSSPTKLKSLELVPAKKYFWSLSF